MMSTKIHRSHINKGRGSNKWLTNKLEKKLRRELKMLRIDKNKTGKKRG